MRLCLGGANRRPCPEVQDGPRCPLHLREMEQARGSASVRGYDRAHQLERERLRPDVEAGLANCARCGEWIAPGELWDLGHTDDRTAWSGPEHRRCNRAAPGLERGRKE